MLLSFFLFQGQLNPQSRVESGSDSNSFKMLWLSLLLPRMKRIQSKLIKIEGTRVATIQNIDFSNIQGQLPQSRVETCSNSNSNSSEMLWLPLLLPRMKKIRSKLKALEWPQHKILIFQTLKGS